MTVAGCKLDRGRGPALIAWLTALAVGLSIGCRSGGSAAPAADPAQVAITVWTVAQERVNRYLRVTGSLVADEEAEVAAETAGRVVATPVERGSRVGAGAVLLVLSPAEARAQVQEAEANVAQIQARLALVEGLPFDVERVPEVAAARASKDLAEADFERIRTLLDQKVVSQAEYDQRRTQVEATRSQYAAARNASQQQYRLFEASRARAVMANKSLADTSVRAPFDGLVVERKVSIGDFVTRGTKVATVVKVSPLRVEVTVPEQSIGRVRAGQPIRLRVDAYPDRVFEGEVRFVSPALRVDQRALTVEAVVPNRDGALMPGMFVTAELQLPAPEPALLVPTAAILPATGGGRLYVVRGDRVEERLVTLGLAFGDRTEVLKGLAVGDRVAVGGAPDLADGARVTVKAAAGAPDRPAQAPPVRK